MSDDSSDARSCVESQNWNSLRDGVDVGSYIDAPDTSIPCSACRGSTSQSRAAFSHRPTNLLDQMQPAVWYYHWMTTRHIIVHAVAYKIAISLTCFRPFRHLKRSPRRL